MKWYEKILGEDWAESVARAFIFALYLSIAIVIILMMF